MAQISLRVDDDLKLRAEKTLDDIDLSMSADPFYSASNQRYLESIMRDVQAGTAHFAEHDLIEAD